MLKGYLIGLLSATLAVLLVAVIWFGTQPPEEEGLLWAGKVYTSRQEFDGYLKSKGLGYDAFVARHPGVVPWEQEKITIGPITVRASTEAREKWVVRLPLVALGLMLATGLALMLWRWISTAVPPGTARRMVAFLGRVSTVVLVGVIYGLMLAAIGLILATDYALLLFQRMRAITAGFARRSRVSLGPQVHRFRKSVAGWPSATFAFIVGLGVATARATRRAGAATFRATGRAGAATSHATRRVGGVTSGATHRVRVSVPRYGERIVSAARPDVRLPRLRRERDISVGYVAFGLLAALTAGVLALFLVSFLSP